MPFVTYILKSEVARKTYVGHTQDKEKRLKQHNRGQNIYAKRFKPWTMIYFEEFLTREDAFKREKYFKSAAGRRWMKKNLFDNQ